MIINIQRAYVILLNIDCLDRLTFTAGSHDLV